MATTVILCNPYGTDVTPFVNNTAGIPQLLRGTVCPVGSGNTLYTLPYNNTSGIANVEAGVALLNTKILNTAGQILVFSYSEGCQVADLWLTNYGVNTPIPATRLSFLSIGNADRKYGGFVHGNSAFNSVAWTGGVPTPCPYPYIDFCRQYDGVADFPTNAAIQTALTDIQLVSNATAGLSNALNSVAALMTNTSEWYAAQNAVFGMVLIHNFYFNVAVSDPCNAWYIDPTNGVQYGLALTYPIPLLGAGWTVPSFDKSLRPQIEKCYTRPMTPVKVNYFSATGGAAQATNPAWAAATNRPIGWRVL